MDPNELYAVFDLETNGFRGASAVSASSIIFTAEGRIVDIFNRFYYPEERPSRRTEAVHGLTLGRIGRFRGEAPYPRHFLEDVPSLAAFWSSWDLRGIVVHNLSFDLSFLPRPLAKERKWWCSMRGLTDFCRLPPSSRSYGEFKWPRLAEAVRTARERLTPTAPLSEIEKSMVPPLSHYGLSDCFELYGLAVRVFNGLPEKPAFRSSTAPMTLPRREVYEIEPPREDDFVTERLLYSSRLAEAAGIPERRKRPLLLWDQGEIP